MNTIFDIEQKQNSQEMLDYAEGKPTKYFLFSDEFNDVARKALEGAVHDVKLDFSWSNKPEHRVFNYRNIDIVQLLVMDFRAEWMLQNTDEVWLLIDRYRPKRRLDFAKNVTKKQSGFKHGVYPDDKNPNRPSEILITSKNMVLDIGQPYYFMEMKDVNSIITASGCGNKNRNDNNAWQYLQFRIKVKKGEKFFYSNVKATIKINLNRNYNQSQKGNTIISYQLK